MRLADSRARRHETGVGVGLLVATAVVPGTFARSLSDRSPVDQGIITALSSGLHYLLTVGTQDALQAGAAEVVASAAGRRGGDAGRRSQRRLTLAADLAAIPLGSGHPEGAARQAGRGDAARHRPAGRLAARGDRPGRVAADRGGGRARRAASRWRAAGTGSGRHR